MTNIKHRQLAFVHGSGAGYLSELNDEISGKY
jgi:hypothetical protein